MMETKVMTQIMSAKEGIITDEMKIVAKNEGVEPEFVREGVKTAQL